MSDILYFEDFPVGKSFEFGRTEISAAQIESYAAAFDPRPRANGGMQNASPIQLCAILMRMNFDGWMSGTAARGAPGVDEVVWQQPAHAGQAVNGRARVLNARVSQSKPEIGFVQFRYELVDDRGKLAMAQTNYVMFGRRDDAGGATERPAPKKKAETVAATAAAARAMPKEWNEQALDQRVATGATTFTPDDIIAFACVYDPQSFHVDETAAINGPFGALAASGWHTASAWMNAYVQACRQSGVDPGRLSAITDLRWLRPTYAGDTIAWDFTPTDISSNEAGETIVVSRNSGTSQDGVKIFEFTAKMAHA